MNACVYRVILLRRGCPSASHFCNVRHLCSSSRLQRTGPERRPTSHKPAAQLYDRTPSRKLELGETYHVTGELFRRMRGLGFQSVPVLAKLFNQHRSELARYKIAHSAAIKLATTSKQWLEMYEAELTPAEVELMSDPSVLRQVFAAFSEADYHQQNIQNYRRLGLYSLHVLFEAGDVEAGLKIAAREIVSPTGLRRPTAEFIREQAMARTDWRAMTIYLWHTLQSAHPKAAAEENYHLAKELFDMVEPGNRLVQRVSVFEQFVGPWKLLHDAADHYLYHLDESDPLSDQVQNDLDMALRAGVEEWKDPEAAKLILGQKDEIEKDSTRWLTLTTQAAMAGSENHCYDLAIYHLRRDGWISRGAPEKTKPTSWMGIEWLALSAALSMNSARQMTRRYLALAHILRESGQVEKGYEWLPVAKEHLQDAGLDPDKSMAEYLDGFRQTWYDDDLLGPRADDFLDRPAA